jgi:diguanylate cyclase (GGDEF)-like protein
MHTIPPSAPGACTLPPRAAHPLIDLVLTRDPKQRRCILVQLLTAALMVVCVGALVYAARAGLADLDHVLMLGLLCTVSSLTFFTFIRSGVNRRYRDPTLAFPQTMVAQTLIGFGYAVGGPFHAAGLLMFALVMVFGMFSMRGRAIRMACLYTITLLALIMAWRVRTDPVHYPLHVELFYFILLATVLPSISALSSNLMTMRLRLKTKKRALEEALEQIQAMATRDDLTGLPNRRAMMAQLEEHARRRARGGLPFYIGMVDLDHFKSVNDTYGHAVGDDVLRAFGVQARQALRTTDLIGRWGGEEFLLVLPETQVGEAIVGVARLRSNLGHTQVSAATPQLRVGFSSGFTRYVDGEQVSHAIERADRALYQAKSAGRNRSVVI